MTTNATGTGVTTTATGTETTDAANVSKNKVTIITAVAKRKELSVEAKKGELMEANMDAMEVRYDVCLCVLLKVPLSAMPVFFVGK